MERVQIVKLLDGNEACVVQAEKSDVKLQVPRGVNGILLANIHTDMKRFSHLISGNDCLIGPICEYFIKMEGGAALPYGKMFKLQIPHILTDIEEVKKSIAVNCVKNGKLYLLSYRPPPWEDYTFMLCWLVCSGTLFLPDTTRETSAEKGCLMMSQHPHQQNTCGYSQSILSRDTGENQFVIKLRNQF